MTDVVTIEIEATQEIALALCDARRRQAIGRLLVDRMLRPTGGNDSLATALVATRQEALAAGLTNADIDAETADYCAERRNSGWPPNPSGLSRQRD